MTKRFGLKLFVTLVAIAVLAIGCACQPKPGVTPPQAACPAPGAPVVTGPSPCGDPQKDFVLGGNALGCKQYDTALALLTCAIDSGQLSKKNLAIAYYWRGLAFLKKGECVYAAADFSNAIQMYPKYEAAYAGRAAAWTACKDKAKAAADYKMFKKLEDEAKAKGWKAPKVKWPKKCPVCPTVCP